jgi:hypothetical protein
MLECHWTADVPAPNSRMQRTPSAPLMRKPLGNPVHNKQEVEK